VLLPERTRSLVGLFLCLHTAQLGGWTGRTTYDAMTLVGKSAFSHSLTLRRTQILNNLKILTTAILYKFMMNAELSPLQWRMLLVLTGSSILSQVCVCVCEREREWSRPAVAGAIPKARPDLARERHISRMSHMVR
jgi:hypothetical protein